MMKDQKGFSHIIILFGFVIVLVALSAVTVSRLAKKSTTADKPTSGGYLAKDFTVNFYRKSDQNLASAYTLTAYYNDSFDPNSDCPAQLPGFSGTLKITYDSKAEATVKVVQNSKPQPPRSTSSMHICSAVVVPSYAKSVTLDKHWVENGSGNKTLQINGKTYHLNLNKSTRTITFQGPGMREQMQPYLPDGVAELYAYPMYRNCMAIGQLQAYAQEHAITTADSKYPDLTAEIQAIPHLVLEAPDGSKNILLVMGNDYVKQLIKDTSNETTTDICHVVASAPVYSGTN